MEIVEGKFYKTRGGLKIGPMRRNSNGWVSDGGRINSATGYDWYEDGSYDYFVEVDLDLIAEWQDELEKEISDMSEVKFKVGDVVSWPVTKSTNLWQNFEIKKVDEKNKMYEGWDSISGSGAFCFHWKIELVKSAANVSTPEPNTKWVFNDGQDFVVRVVGFNDKGQIVLETLISDGSYDLGEYFAFEGGNENFGNFYKPWVEKAEKQKIVGYVTVVKEIGTGRLDFDGSVFDTEQEARDGFDSWTGAWELVDVVKVEWSE